MKINKIILLSFLLYSCKSIKTNDNFLYLTKYIYCSECDLHMTSCAYSKIYFKDNEINFFESTTLKNYSNKRTIKIDNNGIIVFPINKKYINKKHFITIENKYISRIKINIKELIKMKQDTLFVDLKPNEDCNSLDCESSESHGVY